MLEATTKLQNEYVQCTRNACRSYHLKEELPPVAAIKCEYSAADEAITRQPQMAEATGLEPATFGVTGRPFYRKINVL